MNAHRATGARAGSTPDPILPQPTATPARDVPAPTAHRESPETASHVRSPAAGGPTHSSSNGSSPVPSNIPAGTTIPPGTAPRDTSESNLLRRAQAGDRAAFGTFVTATQDRLYNLLVRIVGDREEAKELAQDAYLKALQALPTFRNNAAPYTWLYRIGVNLAIARLRKVRRHRTFSLDIPGSPASLQSHAATAPDDSPAAAILARERGRQVLAALGRLDSEYRAVLVMRDVEGLDYKDISDVLELPLGTVKSRIFRARLAFREELQRYFGATAGAAGLGVTSGVTSGVASGVTSGVSAGHGGPPPVSADQPGSGPSGHRSFSGGNQS